MPRISIATYTIRVFPSRKPEASELLGSLDSGRANFRNVCREFFRQLAIQHRVDPDLQNVHRASQVHEIKPSLWGILDAGEYGWEADIVDSSTMNKKFRRTSDMAEMIPFYFRIYAPDDKGIAILALQRFGNRGIYSALTRALKEYMKKVLPGYRMLVQPVIPQSVLDSLNEGEVTKLRITTYRPHSDYFDLFGLGRNVQQETGSMSIEFTSKYDSSLPLIGHVTRALQKKPRAIALPEDFDPTRTRIQVQCSRNGEKRMVDLSDMLKLNPYYDVTDKIKLVKGHPTHDSMNRAAESLIREVAEAVGVHP